MSEYVATSPGLFPLPDWAKSELSDLKGHQKEDLVTGDESAEINAVYDTSQTEAIETQLEMGLDRVVSGQHRWDDMLAHPLTTHDNVETGGIIRYYDNNNFYRDPQITGELTPKSNIADELTATAEKLTEIKNADEPGMDIPADGAALQAVLPGPYSLVDLATNSYYEDDATFLSAVGQLLVEEAAALPSHETLFLLEPSLVTAAPDDDIAPLVSEVLSNIADVTDSEVIVYTYFGALDEKTYAHLMDASVSALGFDIVAGDREQTLHNVTEYGVTTDIALGVADGQNTLVQSSGTLIERANWFQSQVPSTDFDTVYLTTSAEPFYLPVNKHREKLTALTAAATNNPDVTTEVEA
ncbi:methionine synthase II (cobalamin-independent) [Haloquadratum walsbyi]|jgi:Methionine synthase II (cobalamin-independent)|uniref:Methionine synthase II (Cobalamin-independent) n=1 Tax=Haloquadratum walsbyi J07HQW2 TaxID=1238425 RepID=U1NDM1_9EURY|nr:methionine synthase II (cobalamin-independent) [Haloquadratum walsbyi]ERG95090.1 MAG: methionine synthase II (cobalamin-independent) [Haloquadratum walsbyi J07HQW2]